MVEVRFIINLCYKHCLEEGRPLGTHRPQSAPRIVVSDAFHANTGPLIATEQLLKIVYSYVLPTPAFPSDI